LIAPVLILRFIRTQPAERGIWLTLLGFVLIINMGLWGIFDVGGGISSLIWNDRFGCFANKCIEWMVFAALKTPLMLALDYSKERRVFPLGNIFLILSKKEGDHG